MSSDAPMIGPRLALASLACTLVLACSHSEPIAPTSDAAAEPVEIKDGDVEAAVANAQALLAEIEAQRKEDYAALGADLLEGIMNEDPRLIGEALARLAQSLPKTISER